MDQRDCICDASAALGVSSALAENQPVDFF